jgi:hypothetical protein
LAMVRNADGMMGGYDSPIMKWITVSHLNAFKPPPCSIDSFATRSFPPDEALCNGNMPSGAELIGCPCESANLTSPVLPFAAAEWRPR